MNNLMYKVYRNLHNGKLSIKDQSSGLVVGHCDEIKLSDVTFQVSEAGVARIRRDKRKAVVATVNGHIVQIKGFVSRLGRKVQIDKNAKTFIPTRQVRFNPYKYTSFVVGNDKPIKHSDFTVIEASGIMLTR
jgi:hypothetical protein